MKKWMMAVCTAVMGASLSYGSGLGVFVSQWDPDEDGLDSTTGGGAKLAFGDTFGLELRGSYFDDDALTLIPADIGLFVAIPLGESPLTIYAQGGATWYFLDSDAGDVDDEVGWYAGGGLELTLADNIALFAEAQYRKLEYTATDDSADDLEENDVDVKALTYSGGLLFRF
jgi:opacity protein-like surface antigen